MSDEPAKPRPSQPVLGPKSPRSAGRSVRPGSAAPAVIAPTRVVAAARVKPRRPSPFAARRMRETLVPPCLVVGTAALGLGIAYYFQPADAPLRQVATAVPIAMIVVGGMTLAVTALLAASLRPARRDGRVN